MPREKAIIFLPEAASPPEGFQNLVDTLNGFTAVEVVRSAAYFTNGLLAQTRQLRPIVIAMAPTKSDLQDLVVCKDHFEDARLILVVADVDAETVSLAHMMRPRFMGYMSGGFREIQDVVQKMSGS